MYARLIVAGVIIAALVGGWFRYQYVVDQSEARRVEAERWQAAFLSAEVNRAIFDRLSKSQQLEVDVLRAKKQEVVIQREVQIEYITKYRNNPNVGSCGIPGEFVYQYDSAVSLSKVTDFRPGTNPTRERSFDDQLVLSTIVKNTYDAHENAIQLNSLIKVCSGMIEQYNAEVDKLNKQRGSK